MGVCGSSAKSGGNVVGTPTSAKQIPSFTTEGHKIQSSSNGMTTNGSAPSTAERRQLMAQAAASRTKRLTPSSKSKGVYGDLSSHTPINPNRPMTQWEMENAEALGSSKFDNRM